MLEVMRQEGLDNVDRSGNSIKSRNFQFMHNLNVARAIDKRRISFYRPGLSGAYAEA